VIKIHASDHRVTEHFVITIPERGKGPKSRCKHCNGFNQGHVSLSKDKKNEADLLFPQAIYYSGLPFTVFDNPYFKITFKAINYTPPNREALRTTLLSKTYNNLESRIQSDFLDACEHLVSRKSDTIFGQRTVPGPSTTHIGKGVALDAQAEAFVYIYGRIPQIAEMTLSF